ncbi:MAG: hypothetical protein ABWX84_09650 [Nocardioides sp.]
MSRSASRRTSTVTALLVLALGAGACSGDGGDDAADPSSASSAAGQTARPEVKLRVRVGTLAGELQRQRRRAVAKDVGRVVDRWFEAAYLGGDYPRKSFQDSWPGFTAGARDLAHRDRTLTSNALLGERVDAVRATAKDVKVDVFSPKRRPAGATARFRLVFRTTGKAERRVVVNGRLMLTRVKGTWRVFGFDVKRMATPVGADREKTGAAS